MFRTAAALSVGLLLTPGLVAAQDCPATRQPTTVFFGNGINTPSYQDAYTQMMVVRERLHTRIKQTQADVVEACLSYQVAFNSSSGSTKDVLESIGQIQDTDWSSAWRMLFGLSPMTQQFQDIVLNDIAERPLDSYVQHCDLNVGTCDLARQVYEYTQTLKCGPIDSLIPGTPHDGSCLSQTGPPGRAIILAHSQGNLFANEAFSALTALGVFEQYSDSQLRVVAVASPASFVANEAEFTTTDEAHITLSEDYVANALFPKVNLDRLAPNANNSIVGCLFAPLVDKWTCHLMDYYLKEDSHSELRIMDSIIRRIRGPNTPPIVSAGAIQTVALPATALLMGTVSDDGLPLGSAVATQWTLVSGPGQLTFADASYPTTTVSFTQPGVYVIRLIANDTQLTASSDVTITVSPAVIVNRPPVAGFSMSVPSQITVAPGPLNVTADPLTGEARVTFTDTSSDPDGDPITSRIWTVNTQTAPLSIGDQQFTWGFKPGGPYIVTLSVSDAQHVATPATATGTINVTAANGVVNLNLPNTGTAPEGTLDAHWTLLSGPTCPQGSCPVYTTVTDGFPISGTLWTPNTTTSKWIEPLGGTVDTHPVGQYVYRLSFDVGQLDPSSIFVSGQTAADNQPSGVLLNSIYLTGIVPDASGFAFKPFSISDGFQAGVNTLDFIVNNLDCSGCNGMNPTGVRVELSGFSLPAVAHDDSYSLTQGSALTVSAPGVLSNDTVFSPVQSVEFVQVPQGIAVTNTGGGGFIVDLRGNPDLADPFTLTYVIHTSDGDSNQGTIFIDVAATGSLEVARNDSFTMTQGTTLTVPAPGVLANDTVVSIRFNSVSTFFLTTPPGQFEDTSGGQYGPTSGGFRYTPDPNVVGTVSFTYSFTTNVGASNVATVTITVTPSASTTAPRITSVTPGVSGGDTFVTIGGVNFRCEDPQNAARCLSVEVSVAGAVVGILRAPGQVGRFGFDGSWFDATVTFGTPGIYELVVVNPSPNSERSAPFHISVSPPDPAVVSHDDHYVVVQDHALSVPPPGFLSNDVLPANLTESIVIVVPPAGNLFVVGGGFSYTPPQGFVGTDTFEYYVIVADGSLARQGNTARVVIDVQAAPSSAAPVLMSVLPTPITAAPNDQNVLFSGSGFQQGLTMSVGLPGGGTSTLSGAQIQNVGSNSIGALITFGSPGTYTFAVINPDHGTSAPFAVIVSAPGVVIDNFDDNTIDPAIWTKTIQGSGPSVAEVNNRLEIQFPQNPTEDPTQHVFSAGYSSVCQLRGDFDLQVDYQLLAWPFANGVRVGLSTGLGSTERTSLGSSADFPGQPRDTYITDFGGGAISVVAAGDVVGTLRQVRVGNMVTGYYRAADNWVEISSAQALTGDVSFSLVAWSHGYAFGGQPVQVAFDNLTLNAGTITCPQLVEQTGWRMDGFDASRTNRGSVSGPHVVPAQAIVATGVAGTLRRIGTDGTLFVASGTSLVAYSPNGLRGWNVDLPLNISDVAIGPEGHVYVSTAISVYAFDEDSGNQVWPVPYVGNNGNESSSLAIARSGTVFFHSGDSFVGGFGERLAALRPDGSPIWEQSLTFRGYTNIVLSSDELTVYAEGTRFSALTGEPLGQAPCPMSDPFMFDAVGTLYSTDANGHLEAIAADFSTCNILSQSGTSGRLVALTSIGILVRQTFDGRLLGLTRDGQPLWTSSSVYKPYAFAFFDVFFKYAVMDVDNILYIVGSDSRSVSAIDASNGSVLWTSAFTADVTGIVLGGDGRLYVTSGSQLMRLSTP